MMQVQFISLDNPWHDSYTITSTAWYDHNEADGDCIHLNRYWFRRKEVTMQFDISAPPSQFIRDDIMADYGRQLK